MVSRYEVLAGSEGKPMIREIWVALKCWWTMPTIPLDRIDKLDPTKWARIAMDNRIMSDAIAEGQSRSVTQIQVPEFAVTSKPRHIPWSRRKKELEAAARQKRRQIEEFREQA